MPGFEEELEDLMSRHFPPGRSAPVEVLLLRRFVRAVMHRPPGRPVCYDQAPTAIRRLLAKAGPSELRGVLVDLLPRLAAKQRHGEYNAGG